MFSITFGSNRVITSAAPMSKQFRKWLDAGYGPAIMKAYWTNTPLEIDGVTYKITDSRPKDV
jgi:hypothetical protein